MGVVVDPQMFERMGSKDIEGEVERVPPGRLPLPSQVVVSYVGDPWVQVRLDHIVRSDADVPDKVGFALQRALARFPNITRDGTEVDGGDGTVVGVGGPGVQEGVIVLEVNSDGEYDRALVAALAAVVVDELGPLGIHAEVSAAPMKRHVADWVSAADRALIARAEKDTPVRLDPSVAAQLKKWSRDRDVLVAVRVRLDGLDHLTSARAVTAAMTDIDPSGRWHVLPTANGTYLLGGHAVDGGPALGRLATDLSDAGYTGVIRSQNETDTTHGSYRAFHNRPTPVGAVLAFTVDPPYEDGPFYDSGVVESRWGVPADVTAASTRRWAEWIVPEDGSAWLSGLKLTRVDAADVLAARVTYMRSPTLEFYGVVRASNVVRVLMSRNFGEVLIIESGSGKSRAQQALEHVHERLLPEAPYLDYAAIRVMRPATDKWAADGWPGHWWGLWNRQIFSEYVPQPHPIQILTDAHLDKARDLSSRWDVTKVADHRWLVQAKDLAPWLDGIDEEYTMRNGREWPSLRFDPDLLEQARRDFGDMVLTEEIATATQIRGPKHN